MANLIERKQRRSSVRTAEQIVQASARMGRVKLRIEFKVYAPERDTTTTTAWFMLPGTHYSLEFVSTREVWQFFRSLDEAIKVAIKRLTKEKVTP